MHPATCHHCGYELTGLAQKGMCPECGERYDTESTYRARRPEHTLARHAKPLGLGLLAVSILVCGGVFTLFATNKMGLAITTLLFAVLPAFGAFASWWSDRAERRQGD